MKLACTSYTLTLVLVEEGFYWTWQTWSSKVERSVWIKQQNTEGETLAKGPKIHQMETFMDKKNNNNTKILQVRDLS